MVVEYLRDGDIGVLRVDNPPVNALSQAVRQGIWDGMDRAEADPGLRAVVIVGAGRVFFAGADIKEFGKPLLPPGLPELINRIEGSPLLVVASMHGVSLGGGLEVALGCHYRTAVPSARVGLPEVNLGLIPGAGGTQRLPRLTGPEAALGIMPTGRHVPADEALALGILDRVEDGDPQSLGVAFANELLGQGIGPRPVRALAAPAPLDWDAQYQAVLAKGRGQIAPAQCVRAVQAASELGFDDGLAAERKIFSDLMQTDQRQGMIHAFFGERAVRNVPELRGVAPRPLDRAGVVGGGTMGAGIATALLLADLPVTLVERDASAADDARNRVTQALNGALARGKITKGRYSELLSRLETVAEFAALAPADIVIEAVFEEMEAKAPVFEALDAICKPGAVLATNTSYLDVEAIAALTARPSDVLGLHFFSPAHVMKLLEVVVPGGTAPDVAATGFALGARLGKVAVRSGVGEGFIGNRILNAYRTACDHMVIDGASPYDIDRVVEGFGFAMGPFAVADLAGLDIAWAMRKRKRAEGLAPGQRDACVADRLCAAGQFGRKTGRGYYFYGGQGPLPNPDLPAMLDAERAAQGVTPRPFTDDDILSRFMAAVVNEAAKAVGEGIARRPVDVDMVMLFGYGFPRYRGGPLKWADIRGLEAVLSDIRDYAREDAQFWTPAPLLQTLAAEGRSFDDLNKA